MLVRQLVGMPIGEPWLAPSGTVGGTACRSSAAAGAVAFPPPAVMFPLLAVALPPLPVLSGFAAGSLAHPAGTVKATAAKIPLTAPPKTGAAFLSDFPM
jgi:hypothetical protein